MDQNNVVIEMREITKKFGDFTANDGINIRLHKGEIHALLGENGAGKSTLMNQLYGLIRPTSGEILVGGKPVSFSGPRDAIAAGIGMVHQHFMLVEPFTVTENIVLGNEPERGIRLDMEAARRKVLEISEKYGFAVDPDARIEDISVGMQQRVEILKTLYRGAEILILDEPTASLTPQEILELMRIMRSLAEDGKSFLIITHKLKEIKAVADYCTVIRKGKYIDTVKVSDVTEDDLASLMVGRKVNFKVDKKEMTPGRDILSVKDLHIKDYRGVEVVKGLSLTVRAGEIVGIAGIDGNGQTELVSAITGLMKGESGEILVNGTNVLNQPPRFGFDHGVSSIPADRQKHGLVLSFPVEDNLILQDFWKSPWTKRHLLQRDVIADHAKEAVRAYDIRPEHCEKKPAGTLSGGNQQKVVIAREVMNDKDLLIAVNPTRGLDVGAIEFIHQYLVEQRNRGKAVLLVSFELDEILSLSDTIAVIFDGRIQRSMPAGEADENTLGFLMAGGKTE